MPEKIHGNRNTLIGLRSHRSHTIFSRNELNLQNRPDQSTYCICGIDETESRGMVQIEDNHRHATVAKQLLLVF